MNALLARASLIPLCLTLVVGGVVAAAPAEAAACTRGTGVTVVVGSDVRCVGGAGRSAASAFGAAGHKLTRVQRQPGAVCQVNGSPSRSCVNMPPSDAYWGLFWSNGASGTWTYSSSGVDSLSIPKGGWVGFMFQRGASRVQPGATPLGAMPAPEAKPKPASKPSATANQPLTEPTGKATDPEPAASTTPSASATATATPEETNAGPAAKSGQSNQLAWVAAAVMVALLLGMWGAMWRRRSRP